MVRLRVSIDGCRLKTGQTIRIIPRTGGSPQCRAAGLARVAGRAHELARTLQDLVNKYDERFNGLRGPEDICLWSLFRASGNAELLRVFLEAGANPNVNDENGSGCTLLHYLTGFPDTKPSIEVLLEFKANINARDSFFGFTPLTWTVVHRRLDMVQFLLAHGAAIELPNDQPWTPRVFGPSTLKSRRLCRRLRTKPSGAPSRSAWPWKG
jgi:hypothetical protein